MIPRNRLIIGNKYKVYGENGQLMAIEYELLEIGITKVVTSQLNDSSRFIMDMEMFQLQFVEVEDDKNDK